MWVFNMLPRPLKLFLNSSVYKPPFFNNNFTKSVIMFDEDFLTFFSLTLAFSFFIFIVAKD